MKEEPFDDPGDVGGEYPTHGDERRAAAMPAGYCCWSNVGSVQAANSRRRARLSLYFLGKILGKIFSSSRCRLY